jgi:ubiquinone/menaquinone biosynthesis C-methylase UbiE
VSELAFSFGRIAAEYDDVRPEYDLEALRRAEEVLGLSPDSACVVDLAAGSGKLTRPLARRFPEVIAIEPNEEMRAVLAQRSAGIKVLAGTAERMPLPDDSADAVFVGDAFHWFDGPAAVAELTRVLRPNGGVALLWNHWWSDGDDRMVSTLEPALPAEAQAIFDKVYNSSGRAAARAEMAAPLDAFAGDSFTALVEEAFSRSTVLSAGELVDLYATVSAVASLPPQERTELKRAVLALLEPSYRLEITTLLQWTRRA